VFRVAAGTGWGREARFLPRVAVRSGHALLRPCVILSARVERTFNAENPWRRGRGGRPGGRAVDACNAARGREAGALDAVPAWG